MTVSKTEAERMDITVNGEARTLTVAPMTSLLSVLRDVLGLKGAKEACGRGECGACTVLVRGKPVLACLTLVERVHGEVLTVEGLGPQWGALRESFADYGGFQCGYCTPGQIMRAVALLQADMPTDRQEAERKIRYEMSGNICRCTGYNGIVDAIMRFLDANPVRPDLQRFGKAVQ
jgi:aerobic-type carbon monoxide dehydrogenase small subunit (CoxS/CutS family)